MATKLKVTYLDGRVVEVVAKPRAQIMTEKRFKGISEKNRVEASYFLAWVALKAANEESAEFEPWLDLLDDVEEVMPNGEADEDVDPTRLGPWSDSSSSSASPPESPSNTSSD